MALLSSQLLFFMMLLLLRLPLLSELFDIYSVWT